MTANAIQGSDHKSSTLDSNFDQSITISVSPIEIKFTKSFENLKVTLKKLL